MDSNTAFFLIGFAGLVAWTPAVIFASRRYFRVTEGGTILMSFSMVWFLVFLSIAIFGLFSQTEAGQDDPWKIGGVSGEFSETYRNKDCSVRIYADGSGVKFEAYDFDSNGNGVQQNNDLTRSGDLFLNLVEILKRSWDQKTEAWRGADLFSIDQAPSLDVLEKGLGYNLFLKKCQVAVSELPLKVQASFHGLYGIGIP